MSAFDRVLRYGPDNELWIRQGSLGDKWVDTPNPLLEQTRRFYGTRVTPEAIETTIQMADQGFMRDLTDLEYEATRIDPHWSMCDGKRLRAVYTSKYRVVEASGPHIDVPLAQEYAEAVRQQLAWIPNWRQVLLRLNWGHKHGRSAAEKIWKENKGGALKWRIDRINWIHPRRLSFGPDRELRVRDDVWGGLGFERRGLALRDYPYKFIGFTPQLFDEYPEREGYGPRGLFFSFFKRFSKREQLVLLEVFGRPWRIIGAAEGQTPSKEQLDEAALGIDAAAANATGVEPSGMKIKTEQPVQGAGQVHNDVFFQSNDELSKLILGETRTTDAKPSALGSAGDAVAERVSDEVKIEDALDCSDLVTEQIAVDVIALNYGIEHLDHVPSVEVFYEKPPDRTVEIDRTAKVFSLGVALKEDEVYERVGFTKPGPGDRIIKQQGGQPTGLPGMGQSTPTVEEGVMTEDELESDEEPPGTEVAVPPPDDDQAQLSAPAPDFMTLARAAHVLELVRHIGTGPRTVRKRLAKKPPPAT